MIILCHKCAGVLVGDALQPTYSCHCMPGYVRAGQRPTPQAVVRAIQIARKNESLALYDRQKRAANDSNRLATLALLRLLEGNAP